MNTPVFPVQTTLRALVTVAALSPLSAFAQLIYIDFGQTTTSGWNNVTSEAMRSRPLSIYEPSIATDPVAAVAHAFRPSRKSAVASGTNAAEIGVIRLEMIRTMAPTKIIGMRPSRSMS
mgnify:CR=1 FL=1